MEHVTLLQRRRFESEVTSEVRHKGKVTEEVREESTGIRGKKLIENGLTLPSQVFHLTLELVQT